MQASGEVVNLDTREMGRPPKTCLSGSRVPHTTQEARLRCQEGEGDFLTEAAGHRGTLWVSLGLRLCYLMHCSRANSTFLEGNADSVAVGLLREGPRGSTGYVQCYESV